VAVPKRVPASTRGKLGVGQPLIELRARRKLAHADGVLDDLTAPPNVDPTIVGNGNRDHVQIQVRRKSPVAAHLFVTVVMAFPQR
jgi:hypothetical protein